MRCGQKQNRLSTLLSLSLPLLVLLLSFILAVLAAPTYPPILKASDRVDVDVDADPQNNYDFSALLLLLSAPRVFSPSPKRLQRKNKKRFEL